MNALQMEITDKNTVIYNLYRKIECLEQALAISQQRTSAQLNEIEVIARTPSSAAPPRTSLSLRNFARGRKRYATSSAPPHWQSRSCLPCRNGRRRSSTGCPRMTKVSSAGRSSSTRTCTRARRSNAAACTGKCHACRMLAENVRPGAFISPLTPAKSADRQARARYLAKTTCQWEQVILLSFCVFQALSAC